MPFAARIGFRVTFTPPSGFPAWPIVPTQAEMNTELQTNFISSGNATAVSTNFGGIIQSGSAKRRHGVAHPNGNIYILPRNNAQMLVYDTASNVITTFDTGTTQFQGGALSGYNGNIYMMPHESSTVQTVLEINVAPLAVRQISGLANIPFSGASDFQSAVSLGDDIMFFNFSTSANCLIYKPQSNTLIRTSVQAEAVGNEFISGVYHPNGNVYMPPYDGLFIIEYDPRTNVTRRFIPPGMNVSGGDDRYSGGCLGADNKLYFPPWNRNDVIVYDPVANVASQQTWGLTLSSHNFISGTLASDGNIYVAPAPYSGGTATTVLVICTDTNNPAYNTAVLTNFGITPPAVGQWGITAGANNKLLSSDETSGNVWLITTNGSGSTDALLSPYINKGG